MANYVIGVHDGHNSAASILKDGQVLFAIQEERLNNKKNYSGFPVESIRACLDFAAVHPREVAQFALAGMRRTPIAYRTSDQRMASKREATLYGYMRRLFLWYPYFYLNSNLGWSERLQAAKQLGFTKQQVQRYDHHLGHAATAYFGMREDPETRYLVVTMDGGGDMLCCTVSIGEFGKLTRIASTPRTASLGTIYGITTGQMGFTTLEHEYKLMGMAPHASPKYAEESANLFRSLIRVDKQNLRLRRQTLAPTFCCSRRIRRMISSIRFDTVCGGLQLATEEIIVDLVRAAIKKTGIRRVLCAGGVFMNVKANKRVMELPEVDYLGVAPSCGDESMCMGIAWYAYSIIGGSRAADQIPPLGSIYFGNDVSEEDTAEVVKSSGYDYKRYDDIEAEVAKVLVAGHAVARCKGRLEFGARALGNRSILADPKNLDIVRIINRMVKKRDFWMPFAPVVCRELVHKYLVNPKSFFSPYMMLTFDTKENFNDFVAAVHSGDLTARVQMVEQTHNPDYYRILKTFEEITGRGVLLNTSFNLHGYPIVLGPKEAMSVFKNSGLIYLAVGQYLVHK